MSNKVVIGAQWGDEGKAKITDLLAQDADLIIRYQGGCNAGHTVVAHGKTFKFHLIPSGILYKGKTCLIGNGTVILPEYFEQEIVGLKSENIDLSGLKVSPLATITMPWHTEVDGYSEDNASKGKIGTTKKGIGPTYTDKMQRIALKIEDLYSEVALSEKLDIILPLKNKQLKEVYGLKTYTKEEVLELCKKYAEIFKPYVCFDWQEMLQDFKRKGKTVLFEGAQGVMLDVDFGTYPFVTSSNPVGGGACTGSGYGPKMINEVIGVAKAYSTRVGEGPVPTELDGDLAHYIRERGHEYGTVTKRPRRVGYLDCVALNYARRISGINYLALMLFDVLSGLETLKICYAYEMDGKIINTVPATLEEYQNCKPLYIEMPGWEEDITNVTSFDELPLNAQNYIRKIEELTKTEIVLFSVGPDRKQTIKLKEFF